MERLAKEKIAAQNRILCLKRELAQWGDIDLSKILPEQTDITAVKSERSGENDSSACVENRVINVLCYAELSTEAGKNSLMYSSTGSLSTLTTNASPVCTSNLSVSPPRPKPWTLIIIFNF